jgi:hypothetical protein
VQVGTRFFFVLFLLLTLPILTLCQTDPLTPSYFPPTDTNCADYPANVWVTGPLVKVLQNTGTAPVCPTKQAWGTFYGTQNEFVDFQVHYHDTGRGTSGLNVSVSNFVQSSPGNYTISSSTNSLPFNITVYREAYVNVTTPSSAPLPGTPSYNITWYQTAGYYPDPLIPAVDPYYGQTTNAWPVTVAANQNQSAWIDVHIPPAAPAGYYKGTVTIEQGCPSTCNALASIPIVIGVWQWPSSGSMPSTSSLQSFQTTGFSDFCVQAYGGAGTSTCGNYPGANGSGDLGATLSIADFGVFMLDHRLSGANPIYPPATTSFTSLETYIGPLLSGTPGHVKGILSGAQLTQSEYAVNGFTSISNWVTEYSEKGWMPTLFNYSCDEPPNGCSWATVVSNGTTIHANGRNLMPALVTAKITDATANNALNSIDWMVTIINDLDPPGGTYLRPAYNTWLSGTCCGVGTPKRKLWSYLDCESAACGGVCYPSGNCAYNTNWPNWQIDGYGVANRVMEWLTFYHQESGELYFGTTICWSLYCGGGDPWVNVSYNRVWGDGTLVYPGRQAGSPVSGINVGTKTPIWIPSVRLKNIRDGYQDYEYLNVLTNNNQSALVQDVIQSWIANSTNYNTTLAPAGSFTSDLSDARMTLGNALHQLTYPKNLLPPPVLSGTIQ